MAWIQGQYKPTSGHQERLLATFTLLTASFDVATAVMASTVDAVWSLTRTAASKSCAVEHVFMAAE